MQLAVAAAGLVPVAAGLGGILLGSGMIDPLGGVSVPLDSHYRYLSGLLLGMGFGFWLTIPHIERESPRFQLLTGIIVVGGVGRLWSLLSVGVPDRPMLFGLTMELAVTPLLAVWQYRIAKGAA